MEIDWRPVVIAVLAVIILVLAGMCIGVGINLVSGGYEEQVEYSYISPQKVYKYSYKDGVAYKQEILYATKTVDNGDGTNTYYLNDGAKIIRSDRYTEVIYPDKNQKDSYWNTDIESESYSPSLDSVWKSIFGEEKEKKEVTYKEDVEIKRVEVEKIDFESLVPPPSEVVEKGHDILVLGANENPPLWESIFT